MRSRAVSLSILGAWLLCLLVPPAAEAVEFYTATGLRKYSPADSFSLYYSLQGSRIMFDDVTVPYTTAPSTFEVTKVTVKIGREASAPALRVIPYFGQIVPDASLNGGPGDLAGFPDVGGVTSFASPMYLPAKSGGSFSESTLVFGNGSSTLFSVTGSTAAGVSGFQSFAVGLNLAYAADANSDGLVDLRDLVPLATHWMQSGTYQDGDFNLDGVVNSADLGVLAQSWQFGIGSLASRYTRNGWTVATQNDNLDLLWDYGSPTNFGEFTYGVDSQGADIHGIQWMRIEGNVIEAPAAPLDGAALPEPACLSILALCAIPLLSRLSRYSI